MAEEGFVEMTHPEVGATAQARRAAFEEVWAPRGWVEIQPTEPEDPTGSAVVMGTPGWLRDPDPGPDYGAPGETSETPVDPSTPL